MILAIISPMKKLGTDKEIPSMPMIGETAGEMIIVDQNPEITIAGTIQAEKNKRLLKEMQKNPPVIPKESQEKEIITTIKKAVIPR